MMTPAQKIMADAMLEADFQQKVIERCEALDLRVWHDEDSRRSCPEGLVRVVSGP